jgi:hypothetical protein
VRQVIDFYDRMVAAESPELARGERGPDGRAVRVGA